MTKPACVAAATLLLFVLGAAAQTDAQALSERYRNDLKLCNDEPTSAGRLQCRRDAKQEYDSALAQIKAKQAAAAPPPAATSAGVVKAEPAPVPAACPDCGVVIEVSAGEKAGEGGAAGLIAGGVGGALLGRQIGKGSGRDVATVAGAVGGALAGKKIEEKIKTHKVWAVGVQYPNGSTARFEFDKDPGFRVGDAVRNSDKTIVHR